MEIDSSRSSFYSYDANLVSWLIEVSKMNGLQKGLKKNWLGGILSLFPSLMQMVVVNQMREGLLKFFMGL